MNEIINELAKASDIRQSKRQLDKSTYYDRCVVSQASYTQIKVCGRWMA